MSYLDAKTPLERIADALEKDATSGMSNAVPDLFVKLSYYEDEDSGENKYTLDKTFDEISTVYSNGGVVKFQWIEDDHVEGYYFLNSIEPDDDNNPVLYIKKQEIYVDTQGVKGNATVVSLKADGTMEWPDELNISASAFNPMLINIENADTGIWRLEMTARQLLQSLQYGVYAVAHYDTGSSDYFLPILCSISPRKPSAENQYTFVVDGSLLQKEKMAFKTQNLDSYPAYKLNE